MEREFGSEMVRTFSTRLQHIYQPVENGLPHRIALCLEHLRRAETDERRACGEKPQPVGKAD